MSAIGDTIRRILLWTYSRGSWQWDLMCLFFLAWIFATPRAFLEEYTRNPLAPAEIHTLVKSWFSRIG